MKDIIPIVDVKENSLRARIGSMASEGVIRRVEKLTYEITDKGTAYLLAKGILDIPKNNKNTPLLLERGVLTALIQQNTKQELKTVNDDVKIEDLEDVIIKMKEIHGREMVIKKLERVIKMLK